MGRLEKVFDMYMKHLEPRIYNLVRDESEWNEKVVTFYLPYTNEDVFAANERTGVLWAREDILGRVTSMFGEDGYGLLIDWFNEHYLDFFIIDIREL